VPMRVGRRRTLPAGRALVGGFLVAVAAVVVFTATLASAGGHGQRYAVASRALATGSVIGPGDVETEAMTLPPGSKADAFQQTASLVGRSVAVAIRAGDLIQQSMLVPSADQPATRPVSVGVDPSSLAGLAPGVTVDVIATVGSGSSATVSVVMRGAVLMDVDNSASSVLSGPATSLVTLGVGNLSEVESVIQASQSGTISLVAAEPSDGVGPGPGSPGT
jgi:Flp pilus assembly protein CpaB